MTRPAERLLNETIEGGWKVKERIKQKSESGGKYSFCYLVENEGKKAFLKAFDYSELHKAGASLKKIASGYERERDLLKRCSKLNSENIIGFIAAGKHFLKPNDLNELVEYFIIEYSEDGNIEDKLTNNSLSDLQHKFECISNMFKGLHVLHKEGVLHLDLKPSNLVYFISERLTKITDFGSAREWINEIDDDLKDDLDRVMVTRTYAPPEHLYNTYDSKIEWQYQRRKIDLYLAGNVIVKLFTNFSFTAILRSKMCESESWNNNINSGKYRQVMPVLISAFSIAIQTVKEKIIEINNNCEKPLTNRQIDQVVECIRELCHPDFHERGYPKVIKHSNDDDGLDRYRDRFILLAKKAGYKIRRRYKIEDK